MEGRASFEYDGSTVGTWYKVFGDLKSGIPLVVLHGGPGGTHDYMLPLADLAPSTSVVLYDQLGSGKSYEPAASSKPNSFWSHDLFVAELSNLLSHLELSQPGRQFDILGHSWGTTVASEFVIRSQPSSLRRLILANGLTSVALRIEAKYKLLDNHPAHIKDTVRKHEAAGTTSEQEYKDAWAEFHSVHSIRVKPIPEEVAYSISQSDDSERGGSIWKAMSKGYYGSTWSVINRLHLIRVPTLVINGKHEYMTDEVVGPFFWNIEKAKWIKFGESSHMPQWEEREAFLDAVRTFLTQ